MIGARPGTKLRALLPPELGYAAQPGGLPQVSSIHPGMCTSVPDADAKANGGTCSCHDAADANICNAAAVGKPQVGAVDVRGAAAAGGRRQVAASVSCVLAQNPCQTVCCHQVKLEVTPRCVRGRPVRRRKRCPGSGRRMRRKLEPGCGWWPGAAQEHRLAANGAACRGPDGQAGKEKETRKSEATVGSAQPVVHVRCPFRSVVATLCAVCR